MYINNSSVIIQVETCDFILQLLQDKIYYFRIRSYTLIKCINVAFNIVINITCLR